MFLRNWKRFTRDIKMSDAGERENSSSQQLLKSRRDRNPISQ
jgi:hypothetical protein